jgi:hypothetical protein
MPFFRRLLTIVLIGVAAIPATEAIAGGIGFRNHLKVPIYVYGYTVIKGVKQYGQPILIKPGQIGWDNKLPNLPRVISIYDATQPNQAPLLRDVPIPFQGFDLFFGVGLVPPGKVTIVPEKAPTMMPQQ